MIVARGEPSGPPAGSLSLPEPKRPESQPPASGLQGITPIPYSAQAGSTSASMPRTSIE